MLAKPNPAFYKGDRTCRGTPCGTRPLWAPALAGDHKRCASEAVAAAQEKDCASEAVAAAQEKDCASEAVAAAQDKSRPYDHSTEINH